MFGKEEVYKTYREVEGKEKQRAMRGIYYEGLEQEQDVIFLVEP